MIIILRCLFLTFVGIVLVVEGASPLSSNEKILIDNLSQFCRPLSTGPCVGSSLSYNELCDTGVGFMQRSQPPQGITCFYEAFINYPDLPRATILLSQALTEQGFASLAEDLSKLGLQKNPDYGELHLTLGKALYSQKKYESAREHLQKGVTIQPTVMGYYELGQTLRALGDIEAAISTFHEASGIFDQFGDDVWFSEIGRTLQDVGRYDEALLYLRLTVMEKPDNAYYHYNLASVYEKMQRFDEAMEELDKCIDLKWDIIDAHKRKGNIYSKLGDAQKALASYKTAIQINPDDENLKTVIEQMEAPSWWADSKVDALLQDLEEEVLDEEDEKKDGKISVGKEEDLDNIRDDHHYNHHHDERKDTRKDPFCEDFGGNDCPASQKSVPASMSATAKPTVSSSHSSHLSPSKSSPKSVSAPVQPSKPYSPPPKRTFVEEEEEEWW